MYIKVRDSRNYANKTIIVSDSLIEAKKNGDKYYLGTTCKRRHYAYIFDGAVLNKSIRLTSCGNCVCCSKNQASKRKASKTKPRINNILDEINLKSELKEVWDD